jgi:hypothetical protein
MPSERRAAAEEVTLAKVVSDFAELCIFAPLRETLSQNEIWFSQDAKSQRKTAE